MQQSSVSSYTVNSRYNQVGYNELSGYNEVVLGPLVINVNHFGYNEVKSWSIFKFRRFKINISSIVHIP